MPDRELDSRFQRLWSDFRFHARRGELALTGRLWRETQNSSLGGYVPLSLRRYARMRLGFCLNALAR